MSHKINQLKKKKARERAVRRKVLMQRAVSRKQAKVIRELDREAIEANKTLSNQLVRGLATNQVIIDEKI